MSYNDTLYSLGRFAIDNFSPPSFCIFSFAEFFRDKLLLGQSKTAHSDIRSGLLMISSLTGHYLGKNHDVVEPEGTCKCPSAKPVKAFIVS